MFQNNRRHHLTQKVPRQRSEHGKMGNVAGVSPCNRVVAQHVRDRSCARLGRKLQARGSGIKRKRERGAEDKGAYPPAVHAHHMDNKKEHVL